MRKITIIGKYNTAVGVADGQAVKTRIVSQELERAFGADNVRKIDTYGWKKNPLKLFVNCVRAVLDSENIIFATDAGGIKVFPWLLVCSNVFAKRKLHYLVIGGWLVHYIRKNKMIAGFLKRLDCVFVETRVMQQGLEELGFQNVYLMPNFKELSPLSEEQLCYCTEEPYRFCTFSRVLREKGIEEAINAVQGINDYYGRTACTLDIYGPVDPGQTDWFESLTASFSDAIRYCGVMPYEKSVDVIKDYHLLLFPTKFYTEGIPGTIIDAYAAGVPVVSSEWESFGDVVEHGVTGVGYPFEKPESLQKILMTLIENPEKAYEMKKNCLVKAKQYLPDAAKDVLLSKLA